MLHKGPWAATLLGALLGVQDYKTVKIQGRDNSSLAVKGLNVKCLILCNLGIRRNSELGKDLLIQISSKFTIRTRKNLKQ